MEQVQNQDSGRRLFLWGTVLAWLPVLPIIYWIVLGIREFANQKQTGLGAVAGGVSEVFVTIGLVVAFAVPLAGIVLLVRSFSGRHRLRSFFTVISILWSALILLGLSCAMWLLTHATQTIHPNS
jgi:hypothetical protein